VADSMGAAALQITDAECGSIMGAVQA